MTTPPPSDPFAPEPGRSSAPQSGSWSSSGSWPQPGSAPQPGYGYQHGSVPQPGSYGPPPHAWGGAPQTESKAVIALVCAIGAFVVLPVVPAIAALFLASSARRDIESSGGRLTGEGLVTAAKVIAWVHLVLAVLAVVALVLFFASAFGVAAVAAVA